MRGPINRFGRRFSWTLIVVSFILGLGCRKIIAQATRVEKKSASEVRLDRPGGPSRPSNPPGNDGVPNAVPSLEALLALANETVRDDFADTNNQPVTGQERDRRVYDQLNPIHVELQRIVQMMIVLDENKTHVKLASGIRRTARSSPLGVRQSCNVSRELLISFSAQLSKLMGHNENGPSDSGCDFHADALSSMSCNDLTRSIQCGFVQLRHVFANGFPNESMLFEKKTRVMELSALVDELRRRETSTVDNREQETRQNYEKALSDLTDRLQQLGKSLTYLTEMSDDDKMRIFVLAIGSGNFDEAFNVLQHIEPKDTDRSRVHKIIRTAYLEKGIYNLIMFLSSIPNCHWDEIAYPILYDIVNSTPEEQLLLSYGVNTCLKKSELARKVNRNLERIIENQLAPDVRRNNFEYIIKFTNNYPFDIWSDHITTLVEKSFSSLRDVLNIIRFLQLNNKTCPTLRSVKLIFEKIGDTSAKEMKILAQYVYSLSDDQSSNKCASFKDAIKEVKMRLPYQVSKFYKNGICQIKNKRYNEYLYASNDAFSYDSINRAVFTWVPEEPVSQGFWIFEPTNDFSGKFRIKNTVHDDYLIPPDDVGFTDDTYYKVRNRLDSYITESQQPMSQWNIEQIHSDLYKITVDWKDRRSYLGASSHKHDSDRRKLFVESSSSLENNDQCQWHITCSN